MSTISTQVGRYALNSGLSVESSRADIEPRIEKNNDRFDTPHAQPAAFNRYLPALDGLRGYAIIAVFILHLYVSMQTDTVTRIGHFFENVVQAGWVGVDLFFVLSGFLITNILLRSRGKRNYFRNFYARRALRIFPLYYGVLIMAMLGAPLFRHLHLVAFESAMHHQLWLWLYGTNLVGMWDPAIQLGNFGHFWSLAVEEHFYLIWPAIIFFFASPPAGRNHQLKIICICGAALALALRIFCVMQNQNDVAYQFTFCRVDAMLIGALAAIISGSPLRRAMLYRISICAGAIIAILICARRGWNVHDSIVASVGMSLNAIVFAGLVVAAAHAKSSSLLCRGLTMRPLMALGRYSYGIYVLHFPLLPLVRRAVSPTLLQGAPFVITAAVLSLGLAVLSYHFFETPFLRLKVLFPTREESPKEIPVEVSEEFALVHA